MAGLFEQIVREAGEGLAELLPEEAANWEPVPTIVVIGGIDIRRIEVQIPGVIAITVGSRGPVVAVAASIVERTIIVVAREQKQHSRRKDVYEEGTIGVLGFLWSILYEKVIQLVLIYNIRVPLLPEDTSERMI